MTVFSRYQPLGAAFLMPLVLLAVSLINGTAFAQDGSPPTTVEVLGQSTLDVEEVAGPRFIRINFDGLSTASHTVSVSWIDTADADIRYNVFDETTGDRLNVGAVQGNNPGLWTGDLNGGQPYSIRAWAFSGVADVTISIEASVPLGIEQQPADLTVTEGDNATFTVEASGSGEFTYQWFANGSPLPGETADTLTLIGTTLSDDGNTYTVDISNGFETLTSDVATLAVNQALPSTVVVLGVNLLDSTTVTAPRFMTIDFDALSTAPHTVSVAWDSNADIRFNVFDETTGDRLNSDAVQGVNPGEWTGDLIGGQPYSIRMWSASGIALVTTSIEASVPLDIAQQPVDLTVTEGDTADFTVVASGSGSFTYQWFADGISLAGETTDTLTLSDTSLIDDGTEYTVEVSNGFETLSSDVATLTVEPAPSITISEQPADLTIFEGEDAVFNVVANGTGTLFYQWFADGVAITDATNSTLTVSAALLDASGTLYSVSIIDDNETLLSDSATLTVEPTPLPTTLVVIGDSTIDAEENAGPRFLRINFDALSTASHNVSVAWTGDADVRFSVFDETTGNRLNDSVVQGSNPGVWTGDLIGGQPYSLRMWSVSGIAEIIASIEANVPLGIEQQPVDVTVFEGESAIFTVDAVGSGLISYQWFANGSPLAGETTNTLTLASTSLIDNGTVYSVEVSTDLETLNSNAATLTVEQILPSTVVVIGEVTLDAESIAGPRFMRFNFDALASVSHTITVDWIGDADVRFNVFDETTGARLTSAAVRGNNPGVWSGDLIADQPYSVRMWSASGIADVTVSIEAIVPIDIVSQPENRRVTEGGSASFFVEATGSGTLTYQWFVNDILIDGETSDSLTVLNATLTDDGSMYSVDISNGVNVVRSEVAFLTVDATPVLGVYSSEADTTTWSLAGPAPTLDFNDTRPGDAWGRRLLRIDDLLLVGGDFTGIAETPFSANITNRPFLAALDAISGQPVTSFQVPSEINSVVRALVLSPSGEQVYVGGDFGVVVLDAVTGQLDLSIAVTHGAQTGRVFDIAVTDTDLYIGGDFTDVNGSFRANIARLSLDGVLDTSWAPQVTNGFTSGRAAPVQAISLSPVGDVVYVGGNFAKIEGTAVALTAAGRDVSLLPVSALDGSVLPERFIPFTTIDREVQVHDIAVTDDYVIITWGGPNFLTFHSFDGTRLQQYRGTGDIQALQVVGDDVLVGHHGEFFGFLPNPIPLEALTDDPEVFVPHRLHVFQLDTPDFAPGQAFTTTSPFGIWGIAAAEDSIWVTGQIESAGTNEQPVDGLARFPALD